MHLKATAATFSPPPAAARKAPPKSLDQVKPNPIPTPDGPVSNSDVFDHEHNQEGEGMSLAAVLASRLDHLSRMYKLICLSVLCS